MLLLRHYRLMFDRSGMPHHLSYSYPPQYASQPQDLPKRYPTAHSTSSAFSANANQSEDWTKISDLPERRRMQNRIAQRNYRKKLKKRLKGPEHRTGFDLASLKQRALESCRSDSIPSTNASSTNVSMTRSPSLQLCWGDPLDVTAPHYVHPPSEDRGMFSSQCASLSDEKASANYATNSEHKAYYDIPYTMDMPSHPSYIQPGYRTCASDSTIPPTKQDFDAEEDYLSPFSRSYASINGINLRRTSQLPNVELGLIVRQTPPLSGSIEHH